MGLRVLQWFCSFSGLAGGLLLVWGWYNTEFLGLMCGFPDFGCFKAWVLELSRIGGFLLV